MLETGSSAGCRAEAAWGKGLPYGQGMITHHSGQEAEREGGTGQGGPLLEVTPSVTASIHQGLLLTAPLASQ